MYIIECNRYSASIKKSPGPTSAVNRWHAVNTVADRIELRYRCIWHVTKSYDAHLTASNNHSACDWTPCSAPIKLKGDMININKVLCWTVFMFYYSLRFLST